MAGMIEDTNSQSVDRLCAFARGHVVEYEASKGTGRVFSTYIFDAMSALPVFMSMGNDECVRIIFPFVLRQTSVTR